MEELQARHRKEAKDLQNRITAKKKQASKKTRKGVNDECDRLEQDLKAQHAAELAALNGDPATDNAAPVSEEDNLAIATPDLTLNGHASPDVPSPPQQTSGGVTNDVTIAQPRKQNRAKARLARRQQEQEALTAEAKAEAASLPDLKAAERERMLENFKRRGLVEKEIRADGHCLYSAFADQMVELGMPVGSRPEDKAQVRPAAGEEKVEQKEGREGYMEARRAAAQYMASHSDDFAPFLEEDIDEYTRKIRDTAEWGGQMELMALARRYGVKINVLQGDGRVEEIVPGSEEVDGKVCWLAYYRHGFGLGEHYNSLRKEG